MSSDQVLQESRVSSACIMMNYHGMKHATVCRTQNVITTMLGNRASETSNFRKASSVSRHSLTENSYTDFLSLNMSETRAAFDDPRVDAKEYLEAKGVLRLFQEIGTSVMYNRPADPKASLVEELKRLKAEEKVQTLGSGIFSAKDVETMFGMFDPMGSGNISAAQCSQAFASLCLPKPAQIPDSVSKEQFCKLVQSSREL